MMWHRALTGGIAWIILSDLHTTRRKQVLFLTLFWRQEDWHVHWGLVMCPRSQAHLSKNFSLVVMAWSWQLYPCKGQPSPRVLKTITRYFKDWMDERDKMFAHIAEIQDHYEVSNYHNSHMFPSLWKRASYLLKKKMGCPAKGHEMSITAYPQVKTVDMEFTGRDLRGRAAGGCKSMGFPVTWVGSESQLHIDRLLLTFSHHTPFTWAHSPTHLHLASWIHRYYLCFSNLNKDMAI